MKPYGDITVTPRKQMSTTAESVPEAFLINSDMRLELTCTYATSTRAQRNELRSHGEGWIELEWLADLGFGDWLAKRISVGADKFISKTNNGAYIASNRCIYELQLKHDTPLPCAYASEDVWPEIDTISCGPEISTLSFTEVTPYRTTQFSSGRQLRTKILHGRLEEVEGQIRAVPTASFQEFVSWYACQMTNNANTFSGGWLVNKAFGAWVAFWSEPWSAVYGTYGWDIDLKLLLTKDTSNDWAAVWDLEDKVQVYSAFRQSLCQAISTLTITAEGC